MERYDNAFAQLKARQEGAKGFVVNSAGGDNHMYGTATIYK